jgi:maltose alpha-D-glucosyltransferase/alpha-amylase
MQQAAAPGGTTDLQTTILSTLSATSAMGQATAADMIDPMAELMQFATSLGKRLGELHAVLGAATDDPDFSPRAASAEDVGRWRANALAQIDAAFAVLRQKTDYTSPAESARAAALVAQRDALLARIDAMAAAGLGSPCTRIHGDFHLGQVLVAQGDVYLVDFEGEPAKPIDARREKSSPMRDVAGLLRSLDYAAAFAERGGPTDLTPDAASRKDEVLAQFLPQTSAAFLQAYQAVNPTQGASASLADSPLLQLFILEKSAYEIGYEAANRPTWVGVPLEGMARIADAMLGANGGGRLDA